ncbi:MAG: type II secretion system F family protein [Bacillota bacterium]
MFFDSWFEKFKAGGAERACNSGTGGSALPDYDVYVMDRKEKTKYMALAAVFIFAAGFMFFQSAALAALLSAGAFFYPGYRAKEMVKRRKAELNMQFKDALYSLSSSLSAGRSLETSFRAALADLRILYPDGDTYIIKEIEYICRRIEMNHPVESALQDFAGRSHLEDIKNLADVLVICRRTGGNLVEVVKSTSSIISDKIEISNEIDLILSKQKYEQRVLNIIPVVIIGIINLGGSGYTDPLYGSVKGYLLMGISLLLLAASFYISKRIMDIKV